MKETITWTAVARKPDSDTTVLCWTSEGEWFSGWWDDHAGCWFDAASGGLLEVVTHWAEPRGPQ